MAIKRIAVMTSGGDAPGMNAAVRAVVRSGTAKGLEVYGIRQAYTGLLNGDIERMTSRDVSGIIGEGGTILQTARNEEFKTDKGQKRGLRRLNEHGIEGMVVIGGDGSLRGALSLHRLGFPVIGAPGSIDNDISNTDMSIGVDTALNTILEALDRIRDTASSHERAFIIEVMGRKCGYLALMASLIGGAEKVMIPEEPFELGELVEIIEDAYIKGKNHCIFIIAEGAQPGTRETVDFLRKHDIGFEVRLTVLGHLQRGGRPTAFDRLLATRMGVHAVELLLEGVSGEMVCMAGSAITHTPIEEAVSKQRALNPRDLELAKILS
ncbi:MAG: 6-phosphofructokinase [Anaerolineae bacterium]|nr:6-phosphofructokinase [Anaerolineae bacterium]